MLQSHLKKKNLKEKYLTIQHQAVTVDYDTQ